MKYVSTRGSAPTLEFADVLLAGLARDGGLYVPETWPTLPAGLLARAADAPLRRRGGRGHVALRRGIDRARRLRGAWWPTPTPPSTIPTSCRCATSGGPALWLAELFHGPTLAFKDVALQLVGRLFDHELARRGPKVTIVGRHLGRHRLGGHRGLPRPRGHRDRDPAPGGPGLRGAAPPDDDGDAPNVHNLAVEGTFDDCQDLVKALFADEAFRDRVNLSAVNSINWARVMAQIVYYVTSAARLTGGRAPVALRGAHRQLRQRVRRLRRPAHGPAGRRSSWWPATPTTS